MIPQYLIQIQCNLHTDFEKLALNKPHVFTSTKNKSNDI